MLGKKAKFSVLLSFFSAKWQHGRAAGEKVTRQQMFLFSLLACAAAAICLITHFPPKNYLLTFCYSSTAHKNRFLYSSENTHGFLGIDRETGGVEDSKQCDRIFSHNFQVDFNKEPYYSIFYTHKETHESPL